MLVLGLNLFEEQYIKKVNFTLINHEYKGYKNLKYEKILRKIYKYSKYEKKIIQLI